ncbi:MAG: MBL fold metallo-hydrolase [Acidimicrobiales bacterium]
MGEFGRGTMALAVFSPLVAACSSAASNAGGSEQTTSTGATASEDNPSSTTTSRTEASTENGAGGGTDGQQLQWARANLGFVSAYVLARGNSAAIIDTGSAGSAETIGQTLQSMGLNYSDVEHLILTHKHGDHAGSLAEVMQSATSAKVYAGEADLGGIDDSPVDDGIVPLLGGEDVFGLQIVSSPGHTAGHVCAFDATTGLLVAGDALFTEGGQVVEGPERFFEDIPQSRQTIRDLAALSYNTLLVGHGDPIEGDASEAVGRLAATLS